MLMHSENRRKKTVEAGEIAGMVGLKDTKTGHTLCDLESNYFRINGISDPVISVAVEPASKQDQENLTVALSKLAEEALHLMLRVMKILVRQLFQVWVSFI